MRYLFILGMIFMGCSHNEATKGSTKPSEKSKSNSNIAPKLPEIKAIPKPPSKPKTVSCLFENDAKPKDFLKTRKIVKSIELLRRSPVFLLNDKCEGEYSIVGKMVYILCSKIKKKSEKQSNLKTYNAITYNMITGKIKTFDEPSFPFYVKYSKDSSFTSKTGKKFDAYVPRAILGDTAFGMDMVGEKEKAIFYKYRKGTKYKNIPVYDYNNDEEEKIPVDDYDTISKWYQNPRCVLLRKDDENRNAFLYEFYDNDNNNFLSVWDVDHPVDSGYSRLVDPGYRIFLSKADESAKLFTRISISNMSQKKSLLLDLVEKVETLTDLNIQVSNYFDYVLSQKESIDNYGNSVWSPIHIYYKKGAQGVLKNTIKPKGKLGKAVLINNHQILYSVTNKMKTTFLYDIISGNTVKINNISSDFMYFIRKKPNLFITVDSNEVPNSKNLTSLIIKTHTLKF